MPKDRFKGTVLEDSNSDNSKSSAAESTSSDMSLADSSSEPVENKPAPTESIAKKSSAFVIQKMLDQAEQTSLFSHEVGQAKKAVRPDETRSAKHENIWFKKYVTTLKAAEFELYGQELLRILSPIQPKTRLVSDGNEHYIVSKAIPNAVALDDLILSDGKKTLAIIEDNIGNMTIKDLLAEGEESVLFEVLGHDVLDQQDILLNNYGHITLTAFIHTPDLDIDDPLENKYYRLGLQTVCERLKDDDVRDADIADQSLTGLGTITVLGMYANETDLKFGNILKDLENRLVKIDGDWLFTRLLGKDGNFDITEDQINALPLAANYDAYNWLDQIGGSQLQSSPKIIGGAGMTQLYAEINEALLKIVLLPNESLVSLATGHKISSDNAALPTNEAISRKQQMMAAVLKYPGFEEYLASEAAEKVKTEFTAYLTAFKVKSKTMLVDEQDRSRITQAINNEFNRLTATVKAVKVSEPESYQRPAPK